MTAVAATRPQVAASSVARDRLSLVAVWAATRFFVLASAAAIQVVGISPKSWQPGFDRHPFALLMRWDSHWYRAIASSGYLMLPHHHSDTAFFPLFPLLLRGAAALGLSMDAFGLVVSNLAFLGALLLVHELARGWVDEATAWRATALLAIFPFSLVFSMVYPESLGLLALCGAALAAQRGRWGLATVTAFAAGLTRPEAVVYAIPLAAAAFAQRERLKGARGGLAAAAVAAAPAGALTFILYLWQTTGDLGAWQASEQTWGRPGGVAGPWSAVVGLFQYPSLWIWRDAVMCGVYLYGLRLARRAGVPRAWLAAGAAVVLLPLLTGSFESIARYGLLVPAAFVGFASALDTRKRRLVALGACLTVGFAALVALTLAAP